MEMETVVVDQNDQDSEQVVLDLDDRSQGPRARRLFAESDWNKNSYFGLNNLLEKRKSDSEIHAVQHSGAKEYYKDLNTFITDLEDMAAGKTEDEESVSDNDTRVKIAIWASFIVNIILVCLKVYVAIRSRSMVVIASALDSILDILSGSVLFVISHLQAMETKDSFPIGKERLEPLGIIVFSTVMFTASMQLIIEATKRLILKDKEINVDMVTIGLLLGTIAVKAILFVYCNWFTKGSSSAEALAQDHRNDVVSNTGAIISAYIGYYYWWGADPIGAIGIGILIMFTWVKTGFEHIRMMTGYRADPNLMKKWTFVSLQHDKRIVCIENIRGYHLSQGFIVEIDIVLPEEMPLNEAHDIGESLQEKLESLPEVERAFVHCDYECDHKPEH